MAIKISKKGTRTIKTLILLVIVTIISSQFLPKEIQVFVYPALMLAMVSLLPVLHQYRKTADFSFFGNLCFAAILTILFLLLLPVVQTIGFMAFSILAFTYVLVALASERFMGSDIDATLMTLIFLVMAEVTGALESQVRCIPAFLVTAVLLDLSRSGFPMWVRGFVAGLVWSALIFGFSDYDLIEISTAIVYATTAGLVAGSLFSIFHLDDDKHIEKILKKW